MTGSGAVCGGQWPPSEAPCIAGVEPTTGVAPGFSRAQGRCGGVHSNSLRLPFTTGGDVLLGSDVSRTFLVLVVHALEDDDAAVEVDDAAAAAAAAVVVEVDGAAAAAIEELVETGAVLELFSALTAARWRRRRVRAARLRVCLERVFGLLAGAAVVSVSVLTVACAAARRRCTEAYTPANAANRTMIAELMHANGWVLKTLASVWTTVKKVLLVGAAVALPIQC